MEISSTKTEIQQLGQSNSESVEELSNAAKSVAAARKELAELNDVAVELHFSSDAYTSMSATFSELIQEMQVAVKTIVQASQEETSSKATTVKLQLDAEEHHRVNTVLKAEVMRLDTEASKIGEKHDSSANNLQMEVWKLEKRLDMLRRPSSVMFPQLISSREATLQGLRRNVDSLRLELDSYSSTQIHEKYQTSHSRFALTKSASQSRSRPTRRERPVNDWFSDEGITFGIFCPGELSPPESQA